MRTIKELLEILKESGSLEVSKLYYNCTITLQEMCVLGEYLRHYKPSSVLCLNKLIKTL